MDTSNDTPQASALSAERVERVFDDCQFKGGEDTSQLVQTEGVLVSYGFNAELPDTFKVSGSGGYTFLGACLDRYYIQWTGLHEVMDQLVQLGIAAGLVEYCAPRELWERLPGGMPYFRILM